MATSVYKIYKCTNKANGKVYVGFTHKALKTRVNEHNSSARTGSDHLLHKAIRKYGQENFQWEVIYESLDRNHTLNGMEKFFINECSSYFETGLGYNMTYGGQGGMLGKNHSDETKTKMKAAWESTKFKNRNPNGIGLNSAIVKAAEVLKGKPSWNAGKKMTYENGGKVFSGKTWVKDPITNKRVWVMK